MDARALVGTVALMLLLLTTVVASTVAVPAKLSTSESADETPKPAAVITAFVEPTLTACGVIVARTG